jgi:hypothetical protein
MRFSDNLDVDLNPYIIDVKGYLEITIAPNIHDVDLEKLWKEQFQRVGRATDRGPLFGQALRLLLQPSRKKCLVLIIAAISWLCS